MRIISEEEVRKNLPVAEAVRLVRESFVALARGEAANQPRRRMQTPGGAVLHSLAGAFGAYFGTKVYSTQARHGAHFVMILFDGETGKPLAMLEANHLGRIRTGAATAVATDLLARKEARRLGLVGSGVRAGLQVEAVARVRRLEEVRVWSRSAEKREAFARAEGERLGLRVRAVETAREAVEGAEIVVTATNAREPVLEAGWVSEGAHVNAMGSNQPGRRELPGELIARADLIAADSVEDARIESGDLILAWGEEDWKTPRLRELGDLLVEGYARGERELTVFKSNGLGVQDVAVGGYVYEAILGRPSEDPGPSRR